MQKQEIRMLFLQSFVKTLILKTKPKPFLPQNKNQIILPDYEIKIEQIKETLNPNLISLPNIPQLPNIPKLPRIQKKINFPSGMSPEEKIYLILKDPSVTGVECPGPGKFILVNKSGRIQTTSLTLSEEDIDEIMSSISQKTRIPIISGVFKAVFGNFLIIAVISQFAGTRFIIQKRSPF